MRKAEFLEKLKECLQGLPKEDLEERIAFYDELIDDRLEEGESEEAVIASLGSPEAIASEIVKDTPLVRLAKEKFAPKRKLSALEIILLILGFPLWFPLLLTAITLCLIGYSLLWVFVLVLYAVEGSLIASFLGGLVAFGATIAQGAVDIVPLGVGLAAAGAAVLFFFVCVVATKGTWKLAQNIVHRIKLLFVKGDQK